MKIVENLKKLSTTQTNLGRALGITQPRVNQLIEEEIIVRDERDANGGVLIFESLKNYFQIKKTAAAEEDLDLFLEKAKHEKVKREQNEIKLQQMQGEVLLAEEVEEELSELVVKLRSNLLGLPAKMSGILEGKSRGEINAILTAEIEEKLEELSEYKITVNLLFVFFTKK